MVRFFFFFPWLANMIFIIRTKLRVRPGDLLLLLVINGGVCTLT